MRQKRRGLWEDAASMIMACARLDQSAGFSKTHTMSDTLTNPPAGGSWAASPESFAALARGCALAPINELGVIAVRGEDAGKFLQSQLTNDVLALGERLTLNGYCSAKGRLIASFHQWREAGPLGETLCLQLPREILPAVMKRLSMFVLRAQVKLSDESASRHAWGLVGADAAAQLLAAGITPPAAVWDTARAGELCVARLPAAPAAPDRFLLTGPALPAPLAARPLSDSGVWWWSEIAAAVPTVWAATQEKFVPQMINFEVLGGVNFKKGCYPGQEIVARSQYLGKLRRRMALAHAAGPVAAGADVYLGADAVGVVVMAAAAPASASSSPGGFDLLFESPVDAQAAGGLRAGAADGPDLHIRPLPYELFDPTA